ncbi:hypothetical protein NKH57_17620 [Mesorhizobium sp. M1050]
MIVSIRTLSLVQLSPRHLREARADRAGEIPIFGSDGVSIACRNHK